MKASFLLIAICLAFANTEENEAASNVLNELFRKFKSCKNPANFYRRFGAGPSSEIPLQVNLPNTELDIPLDGNSFSDVKAMIRRDTLVAILTLKPGKFSSRQGSVTDFELRDKSIPKIPAFLHSSLSFPALVFWPLLLTTFGGKAYQGGYYQGNHLASYDEAVFEVMFLKINGKVVNFNVRLASAKEVIGFWEGFNGSEVLAKLNDPGDEREPGTSVLAQMHLGAIVMQWIKENYSQMKEEFEEKLSNLVPDEKLAYFETAD